MCIFFSGHNFGIWLWRGNGTFSWYHKQ